METTGPTPQKNEISEDVRFYMDRGFNREDAEIEAAMDLLQFEDDVRRADPLGYDEETEDPLEGDVDRWVHPDETRTDEQIDWDERYAPHSDGNS